MTESEWLSSEDPMAMLSYLVEHDAEPGTTTHRISDRKLRLFAIGVSWLVGLLQGEEAAIAEAETWADGGSPPLYAVHDYCVASPTAAAGHVSQANWSSTPHGRKHTQADKANLLRDIFGNLFRPMTLWTGTEMGWVTTNQSGTEDWWQLTPTVTALAEAAYSERQPDGTLDLLRLAILADALEDVIATDGGACETCEGKGKVSQEHPFGDTWAEEWLGCHHCEGSGRIPHPLLAHLRSPGPHYRGMWSLDLILGKE